jgi:hypothetical protein
MVDSIIEGVKMDCYACESFFAITKNKILYCVKSNFLGGTVWCGDAAAGSAWIAPDVLSMTDAGGSRDPQLDWVPWPKRAKPGVKRSGRPRLHIRFYETPP